jgi:hypothetical protein
MDGGKLTENHNNNTKQKHTMSTATTIETRKFELGRVVSTPGAMETFSRPVLLDALARHLAGDWSEMDEEDQESNRQATHTGARVFSAYKYNGERLWVITDGDDEEGTRHCTTFLLPEEY